jgi:polyisoprenoid-binding protein YceI
MNHDAEDRMRRLKVAHRSLGKALAGLVLLPALAGAQLAAPTLALLQSGELSFSAHATVGDFTGSTTTMSGAITGELSNAGGWVEAPVATLVTHNDHRDRDLRASMEVEKFPTMRFALAPTATELSPVSRGAIKAMLRGQLTIHGVTHDVELPAVLERNADTIHVTAIFPLDLADYQIGGLTKMLGMLRMDRHIQVNVDLRFVSTEALNP